MTVNQILGILWIKKYDRILIAVIFSLWALFLRLDRIAQNPPQLAGDGFWQISYMEAQGSFVNMIKNLPTAEHSGYISGDYILIYPFFKIFGHNKWGLAIPHLAINILGFYVLYLLLRRHTKTLLGFAIPFIVICFNWNMVFYSVEIRAYAVLPTMALLILYFSEMLVEQGRTMSIIKKCLIGSVFVLVILFHVYGILMVAFPVLYTLLKKIRQPDFKVILWNFTKFLMVVGLIAAPIWIPSVLGPYHLKSLTTGLDASLKDARNMNTFEYIPNPLVNLIGFLKGIFGNLLASRNLYVLLPGVLIPFFIPYPERKRDLVFFLLLVVLPLEVLLISMLNKGYWFLQRQFTWIIPFFAIYLGLAWEGLWIYVVSLKNTRNTTP